MSQGLKRKFKKKKKSSFFQFSVKFKATGKEFIKAEEKKKKVSEGEKWQSFK